MNNPSQILNEVKKHDLDAFKRLDAGNNGVSTALQYLDSSGNQKMAERLRGVMENGNIRMGPLEGFAALAVSLPQGDFILISDLDPKNSTDNEIMAILVREVGSFKEFNCTKEDNQMRSMVAGFWLKKHLKQPTAPKAPIEHKAEPEAVKEAVKEVVKEAPKQAPVNKIKGVEIDPEARKLIKDDLLRRHSVYPIKIDNGKLVLAMSNPRDLRALEDIEFIVNMPITPVLITKEEILNLLDGVEINDEAISSLIKNVAEVTVVQEFKPVKGVNAKETIVPLPAEYQILLQSESPTVKLVDLILSDAIKARASDVHLEPREQGVDVRYRIDGDLKNILQVPIKFHIKIVARIKILSNLDITQNVSPQDGRIQLMLDDRKIDFRVSTVPTFYGEKIVIRILDSQAAKVDLNILGFDPQEKESFVEAVKSPHGMVLVTGPTGSGKTSTLYAALNFVKNESTNIVTIEDPIEFISEGINQIQVNPGRGVTFASGLRSILRQDPNVILLGEIRDKETADIALKASITGHLLLSTIHTNSCVATITRLADIGMDYFQIASALILVISQRLVKTICPDCKFEYQPDEDFKQQFSDEIARYKLQKFYKGKGCDRCQFTGYKGRVGVFEALKVTENIKNVIAKGAPEEEIYKEAHKNGFKRLMDAGMDKVICGVTSLEEVVKHLGSIEKEKVQLPPEGEPKAPPPDTDRKRKVLVVEDEEDVRKVIGKYLQVAGYEVIQAVNGKEAVEKAIKEKPDLIITDLMMPVMDGFEEVKLLRSTMATAVIPVIMLTAKDDKESELSGINAGADDYITKPFDKDKLLARVGMLLKRESLRHA